MTPCPLLLALYGHPDSGGHWEKRCSKWVQKQGFKPIGHCYEWRSVFWHDRLKLMLVIYVDDFKMSGPKAKLVEGWSLLRNGEDEIEMSDPLQVSNFLGCTHDVTSMTLACGKIVQRLEYNMEEFLQSCCDAYLSVASLTSLEKVTTPFVEEDDRENPAIAPCDFGEGLKCPWCKIIRPPDDFEEVAKGVASQRPPRKNKCGRR